MNRDFLYIGSTPSAEPCVQVGLHAYASAMRLECQAYITALRKLHGNEPEGARLRLKSEPHDFGTYWEVICEYDVNDEAARDYAFRCEGAPPEYWSDASMRVTHERDELGNYTGLRVEHLSEPPLAEIDAANGAD